MRLLIFGLDGATLDLVHPWAAAGKLPTLHRLMSTGCWGPLESTVPPMTSPAWPSFATASYPAKHSVFDFVSAHSGTYNIVNATGIKRPTLWDLLSGGRQSFTHNSIINIFISHNFLRQQSGINSSHYYLYFWINFWFNLRFNFGTSTLCHALHYFSCFFFKISHKISNIW